MNGFSQLLTLLILTSLLAVPLKAQEQQAKAAYKEGEQHRKDRKYAEAIADYELAISYAPTVPQYHLKKGQCHYILKEYETAIETFEGLTKISPQTMAAYNSLWKLYGIQDQPEKMIKTYERAIEAAPKDHLKLLYTVKIIDFLDQQGRTEDMLPYLEQTLDFEREAPETNYVWGKYHSNRSEYEKALPYFEKAAAAVADKPLKVSGQFIYWLGKTYYELGRYPKALPQLRKITAGPFAPLAFQMLPDYYYFVGAAYHDLYRPQAAKDALMHAIQIDPSFDKADQLLTREKVILERAGELANAKLEKLANETDEGKRLQLRVQIAELLLQGKEYGRAKRMAEKYLIEKPDNANMKLLRWMAEFMDTQQEVPLKNIELAAEELSGAEKSRYQAALGMLYTLHGNKEKAIEILEAVRDDKQSDFRHLADYELSHLKK